MHLDGEGYATIIDELNAHGYITKEGNHFGKNSIFGILKNEKYIGVYTYNRSASKDDYGKRNGHAYKDDGEVIRVEDAVPVIISKEDFERAQEIMLNRKHKQARYKAKETYLLSGKMICGECGSSFCGNSRKERPGHRAYVSYMC
jgi:site-specific DNA recombinase